MLLRQYRVNSVSPDTMLYGNALNFLNLSGKKFRRRNFRGNKFSRLSIRSRKSRKFLPREHFPLYGMSGKPLNACISRSSQGSICPVLLVLLLLFVFALRFRPPQLFTLRLCSLVHSSCCSLYVFASQSRHFRC